MLLEEPLKILFLDVVKGKQSFLNEFLLSVSDKVRWNFIFSGNDIQLILMVTLFPSSQLSIFSLVRL